MDIERSTPPEYQCKSIACLIWNHWANPLGNWLEPLAYPEIRAVQARDSWMPQWLWWGIRNLGNNFGTFWIGIQPLGSRYCTIRPEGAGWHCTTRKNWSFWKKRGRITLPYYRHDGKWIFLIGWTSRGNFGIGLRKALYGVNI